MRRRDLESALQQVRPFDKSLQKAELEQYPTSPHIASHIIHTAEASFGDIGDCAVVDLGCGTGMLSIASALAGASSVLGVDADTDAISIAAENWEEWDLETALEFLVCDVTSLPLRGRGQRLCDTVVMNPPFGTRNKGVDVAFLEAALELRPHAIYSLHKTSTRKFLLKKAESWGVRAQVLAELRFDIPKMYQFHKQKSRDIEVDLIRLELPQSQEPAPPLPQPHTPPIAHTSASASAPASALEGSLPASPAQPAKNTEAREAWEERDPGHAGNAAEAEEAGEAAAQGHANIHETGAAATSPMPSPPLASTDPSVPPEPPSGGR